MSETDVLILRPGAGPRRQVLTIAAVIAVVLVVGGVLAGGRPALITCIGLVLLLAATIAVYLWRSRIVVTPADISARGLTFHRRRDRALAASVIRATVVQPGAVSETIVVLDARRTSPAEHQRRPLRARRSRPADQPPRTAHRQARRTGHHGATGPRAARHRELGRPAPGRIPTPVRPRLRHHRSPPRNPDRIPNRLTAKRLRLGRRSGGSAGFPGGPASSPRVRGAGTSEGRRVPRVRC